MALAYTLLLLLALNTEGSPWGPSVNQNSGSIRSKPGNQDAALFLFGPQNGERPVEPAFQGKRCGLLEADPKTHACVLLSSRLG